MPHHTPHQLQQPPSLQPTPQVPPVPPSQPPPGPEPPQPPQKDSQQPAQQPPPPPTQPPKKPSPQPSPPRQAKRAVVSAPAQRGAASSPRNPTTTSTTPPTHTHTAHIPLAEGSPGTATSPFACPWAAGPLVWWEGRPRSQGSSVLQLLLLVCQGPRTCQGSFARPHTAGVGVSLVCQWRGVSLKAPTRGRGKTCRTVAGQQAPLTTVPTARGGLRAAQKS